MKKSIMSLLAISFVMVGCGGGGSSSAVDTTPLPEPITVNLLGTWDYMVVTQNSVCDGKVAQGIEIIDSLDGDTTKIGDIIIDGEGFELDSNQNCYVTDVYSVSSKVSGYQSTGTADDYLRIIEQMNDGDNTIKSIRIDSFNEYKIVTVYEYTNGVIITSQITR